MKIAMMIRTEPHPAPIATVLVLLEVLDTPKICVRILVSLLVELLLIYIQGNRLKKNVLSNRPPPLRKRKKQNKTNKTNQPTKQT